MHKLGWVDGWDQGREKMDVSSHTSGGSVNKTEGPKAPGVMYLHQPPPAQPSAINSKG